MSEKTTNPRRRGPMGHGPAMSGEKAKDFKGTLKKLLHYLGSYKITMVIVMVIAALATIFMIVGPKILGEATTVLFEGLMNLIAQNGKGFDFDKIARILLFLLGLYIVSAACNLVQGFLMTGISNKIAYKLRKEIEEKVHKLPLSYYDTRPYGEVLSLVTNDVDVLQQNLNQISTQVITSLTQLIGYLVMMFSISWQMSLVALLILPISMLFIMVVIKYSQKYFRQQQDYLGHVNGHIEEMYGAHTIVKAYNGEARSVAQFNELNDSLYNSAWRSQFLSGLMMPIMSFISNIGYVLITILGGFYAAQGTITIGDIQAFIQYVRSFNQPIQSISQISNTMQMTMAAAERVFAFLEEQEETPDPVDALSTEDLKGEVWFAHVNFGYTSDKTIINDFTAVVKPGQKVAIVGPTGAGKTTMIKLLMRYYDVTQGAILIDQLDIKQFKRNDLRGLFGMVLQDTWLYHASLKDNIRYGKQDATDEEIYAAAKAAQVDHFIHTLPDGYDSILNEEASNISQGQKQLLTIARAILADPQILILDEATSSVDTRTEISIQKAMDNLMKGRTSFVIAHRLSTIRDADMILVMDHGDIVEKGTHEELLAQNGFYAKLYQSQFEDSDA
ncbi:ABC transporter ATP-binding protein [Massilicoli timonensis]|uniref:ABC transporter ATP-binding protein n=1 Tax=Massilicoli timonensis TaxID=2015901 RepID=UPI000C856FD0|nr:ABC transporter ATP-binding protein [Massilicoli timonensis]HIR16172.1 ABC transporter ATP-binding protein [Candidatus Onthosoma merdavium]